jgi:hypothetical protein
MISVILFVELVRPRDISTCATAASAGISTRDEPELEAAHPSTDVDVVVIPFIMTMVVGFQTFVQIKDVSGNVL